MKLQQNIVCFNEKNIMLIQEDSKKQLLSKSQTIKQL